MHSNRAVLDSVLTHGLTLVPLFHQTPVGFDFALDYAHRNIRISGRICCNPLKLWFNSLSEHPYSRCQTAHYKDCSGLYDLTLAQ